MNIQSFKKEDCQKQVLSIRSDVCYLSYNKIPKYTLYLSVQPYEAKFCNNWKKAKNKFRRIPAPDFINDKANAGLSSFKPTSEV